MLRLLGNSYCRISAALSTNRKNLAVLNTKGVSSYNEESEDKSVVQNSEEPSFNMSNPFEKEQLECILCKNHIIPDYKNVRLLSQFQSPYTGRIYGRHITGLCKKQQELVEKEINKAQSAGLMSTYLKEPEFLRDPELFDVEKPLRPHRF